MNRLIILILSLFSLNQCSFNEGSRIWSGKEKKSENQNSIKKIFPEEKKKSTELNQDLRLNLEKIQINNKIVDNKNNYGPQDYDGLIKKIGSYKFSKLKEIDQLDFKPVFLNENLIFFDKKGTIIKYDSNNKVLWKKNHYSKSEKKLNPKLNFIVDGDNLLITDSIAKYYSINLKSGELNWAKNGSYSFNSEIKKNDKNCFIIDYKNTLRSFSVGDGVELWNFQTEDSFTISDTKNSLIIVGDLVVFSNSIGDITAINIQTGLITWQLPTQSSNIINESYNFKTSKLVSDGKSIYFSINYNLIIKLNE